MRRTERFGRAYICYKTTPAFALFWIVVGAFAWAILLYGSVCLGRYIGQFFRS
jgi:hypothetical protein